MFLGCFYIESNYKQLEIIETKEIIEEIIVKSRDLGYLPIIKGKTILDATNAYKNHIQFDVKTAGELSPCYHVYAHRGASGEKLEHTFDAYDLAIEYGAKCIEQDVVVSKDGTLYVSHDLSAFRLYGINAYFLNLTDNEIDALKTQEGYKVLRQSEIFDRYDDSIVYVIELKSKEYAIEPFIKLVEEYGLDENIIVQCFDHAVLGVLEDFFPDMPKLALCGSQDKVDAAINLDYVDIISVAKPLMTNENCSIVHRSGKDFNAYALDSDDDIKTAICIGVNSYFTNYPGLALEIEKEYIDERINLL